MAGNTSITTEKLREYGAILARQDIQDALNSPGTVPVFWKYQPHPKQKLLHTINANEVLYGGAAGPGKSHALRHEGYDWCLRIPGLQVYLFRRTFPELEKNHVIPSLSEFDPAVCKWNSQDSRWDFYNGSKFHFCHCQYEKNVFLYQGAEIDLLLLDELTTFTEFIYDYLRGRVRPTLDVPEEYRWRIPGIVAASNPGGIGHAFVKERWVDFMQPYLPKQAEKRQGGMIRAFIPGLLKDNPTLLERDPTYIDRLDALPEPYRSAYKDGNWGVFMGQAFRFDRAVHVIPPPEVPETAPTLMTYDWGFAKPFSIAWWFIDQDARLVRFAEWYGWNKTANQGLRLSDPQVAQGVIDREKRFKPHIVKNLMRRIAGPDCFQKKPDYKGGGQGDSTADTFKSVGKAMNWPLELYPGDPTRHIKIRQMHKRLQVEEATGLPSILVSEACTEFIRTIPLLQFDEHNPEDVDSDLEDHVYDEACHALMFRRMVIDDAPVKPVMPPQDITEVAALERKEIMKDVLGDISQAEW